ncbi:unnamed protein product [Pleuronectes platessa]|uniref:Uncharacterized protein n=1 Tax=Pleuronectes platessa TaxID=8262 RepID=A0A9N7YQ87_PLEPL|nr:unnamed protein product [Pleuronectes platessa]
MVKTGYEGDGEKQDCPSLQTIYEGSVVRLAHRILTDHWDLYPCFGVSTEIPALCQFDDDPASTPPLPEECINHRPASHASAETGREVWGTRGEKGRRKDGGGVAAAVTPADVSVEDTLGPGRGVTLAAVQTSGALLGK